MILLSNQIYKTKIYGYGEIYEEVSTNRQLKRITRKYGKPMRVIIVSKCGTQKILKSEAELKPYKPYLIELIPCDNPIWKCAFSDGSSPVDKHRSKLLLSLSRYIFYFLCPIFEFKRNENKAHNKIGVLDGIHG